MQLGDFYASNVSYLGTGHIVQNLVFSSILPKLRQYLQIRLWKHVVVPVVGLGLSIVQKFILVHHELHAHVLLQITSSEVVKVPAHKRSISFCMRLR